MKNDTYLKAQDGLIVGLDDQGNYYRVDGYQHLLLIAPTGAGKGVSFVPPNLLDTPESVIVHDIKLENYAMTSGFRASLGQKIYRFEPLNEQGTTHCYNPLDFVSKDPDQRVDDIQKMALLLMPNHDCHHDLLHHQARGLFTALALCVLSGTSKAKSFGEIFKVLMTSPSDTLSDAIKKPEIHQTGLMLINHFLSKDATERSNIIETLASHLEIWGNPLVDKATSKSDFNPADFRKEKSTLYVGLQPSDINRLKPLMQFFYQHVMQSLIKEPVDTTKEPHGILFMLDDFPSIGKMKAMTTSMPYLRGYRVRLLLIAENISSIKASYCESGMNAILANSTFKVFFTAGSVETANMVSGLSAGNISWQEVMSLPSDQQILLADHAPHMISKKLRYYDRKELKERVAGQV